MSTKAPAPPSNPVAPKIRHWMWLPIAEPETAFHVPGSSVKAGALRPAIVDRLPHPVPDLWGDWVAGQRRGLRRYLWRRLLRHLELQRRLGPTLVGRPAHQRRAAA